MDMIFKRDKLQLGCDYSTFLRQPNLFSFNSRAIITLKMSGVDKPPGEVGININYGQRNQ